MVNMLAKEVEGLGNVVKITVSDPVEKTDSKTKLLKWTEYTVTAQFENGEVKTCSRRFSHFDWLRRQLLENKGYMVPPLPEKNLMGRFDPFFIEKRTRRLELFCQRIIEIPYFLEDNALKMFLNATEQQWEAVMTGDSKLSAQYAGEVYNKMRVYAQQFKANVVEASKAKSPDEVESLHLYALGHRVQSMCANIKTSLGVINDNLDRQSILFTECGRTATTLRKHLKEQTMVHFGDLDLNGLCELLDQFTEVVTKVGNVKKDHDKLFMIENEDENVHLFLRDMIDDISCYGNAMMECVQSRNFVLHQLQAERATLQSRQDKVESLSNATFAISKESRISKIKTLISESMVTVDDWESENERVAKLCKSQVLGYVNTLEGNMRENMVLHADRQIEMLKAQMDYWNSFRNAAAKDMR